MLYNLTAVVSGVIIQKEKIKLKIRRDSTMCLSLQRQKQMIISKNDVLRVAHLARIELNQDELDLFSGQLESVLEFIEKLKKADISSVKPMSHILDIQNVLRVDASKESLPNDQVLKNAPESLKGHFRVPRVIE